MGRSHGSSRSSSSGLHAAPEDDDYESFPESYPFIGLYDRPLPCCGCGIGWFSFILGFVMPLAWCYGAFLYWTDYYHYDPRERSGLAACAVVSMFILMNTLLTYRGVIYIRSEPCLRVEALHTDTARLNITL